MNPTLALFWKEGREAAYKVVACAGLAMIVALVSAGKEEYHDLRNVRYFGHLVGLFGAVLFGMDAVARRTQSDDAVLPVVPTRGVVEDNDW